MLQVKLVNENAPADALQSNDQQIGQLASGASQDMLNQMIGELQTQYGVSFNRTLADQLMTQR